MASLGNNNDVLLIVGYNYNIYICIYIYINIYILKVMNLKRGVGIDHCHKSKEQGVKHHALASIIAI